MLSSSALDPLVRAKHIPMCSKNRIFETKIPACFYISLLQMACMQPGAPGSLSCPSPCGRDWLDVPEAWAGVVYPGGIPQGGCVTFSLILWSAACSYLFWPSWGLQCPPHTELPPLSPGLHICGGLIGTGEERRCPPFLPTSWEYLHHRDPERSPMSLPDSPLPPGHASLPGRWAAHTPKAEL
jgi:hypothetical protein